MYLYKNDSMGIWLLWVKVACYMEEFENHVHWWLSSAYVVEKEYSNMMNES